VFQVLDEEIPVLSLYFPVLKWTSGDEHVRMKRMKYRYQVQSHPILVVSGVFGRMRMSWKGMIGWEGVYAYCLMKRVGLGV
jgi:hypothetical protein